MSDLKAKLAAKKAAEVAPEPVWDEPPIEQRAEPPDLKDRPVRPKRDHLPDVHLTIPQSENAEKGVIGSILIGGRKSMYICERRVGEKHFFQPSHATIYKVLKEMHEDNESLDFITLTEVLEKRGQLEEVGGAAAVTDLFTFVPTASNVEHYLTILEEKHALRELYSLSLRIQTESLARGEIDPALIVEQAQHELKVIQTARRIGQLPELDDMSTLIGANLPKPPAELVQGVLHRGSKLIIGGTSKGRKTFSLMDLGISVASGATWWGLPTIKGKVCYINFEIQKAFFAKRYEDICRKKEITPELGMFRCWTLRGLVDGIEKMSAEIIKVLLQEDYALIIFDPIYKALGDRDENKAGDVASMLNELEAIAVKTGAAIAFGAHYSKGNQAGKESIDRIGGSGVFARDPDAILTMTPHTEEECFTVDTTLRNFPPQKAFVVRWEWPLFHRDEMFDPEDIKKPKPFRTRGENTGQFEKKYSVDDILNCLQEAPNGRTPSELLKLVEEETGMKKSKFWMLWDEAKKSPFVVKREKRFFHTLPKA